MTTSEAANYVGVSKNYIRKYLDPVIDNKGYKIREGRELIYHKNDVDELKKYLEGEKKREVKETIKPEDLSPEERKVIAGKSYKLKTLRELNKIISDVYDPCRLELLELMKNKSKYTGDKKVLEGISIYPKKEFEINDQELSRIISLDELVRLGIKINPDVKSLREKGVKYVKEKLRKIVKNFVDYCNKNDLNIYEIESKDLKNKVSEFLSSQGKRQNITISKNELFRLISDLKNNRLGEKRLGKYARELVESCIKEKIGPPSIRITLTPEFERLSKETAENMTNQLNLSYLDEIAKKLPVD